MGRPTKSGLTYFPMDTQFFSDRKIQRLRRACGDRGVIVYLYILTLAYNDKGYYAVWDSTTPIDIANEFSYSEKSVEEIVQFCIKTDLIDERLFKAFGIVTSSGMQNRYVESIKTMNRLPVFVETDYLLINPETLPKSKFRLTKEVNPVNCIKNIVKEEQKGINLVGNEVSRAVNYDDSSFCDSDGGEYHLSESTLQLVKHLVQVFQKRDKCRLDIRPIELQSLMQLREQIGGEDVDEQIDKVVSKFDNLPIFQIGGKFYGWSMLTLLKYKNFDMIKSGMFDVNISKPITKGAGTMSTALNKPVDDIPF